MDKNKEYSIMKKMLRNLIKENPAFVLIILGFIIILATVTLFGIPYGELRVDNEPLYSDIEWGCEEQQAVLMYLADDPSNDPNPNDDISPKQLSIAFRCIASDKDPAWKVSHDTVADTIRESNFSAVAGSRFFVPLPNIDSIEECNNNPNVCYVSISYDYTPQLIEVDMLRVPHEFVAVDIENGMIYRPGSYALSGEVYMLPGEYTSEDIVFFEDLFDIRINGFTQGGDIPVAILICGFGEVIPVYEGQPIFSKIQNFNTTNCRYFSGYTLDIDYTLGDRPLKGALPPSYEGGYVGFSGLTEIDIQK